MIQRNRLTVFFTAFMYTTLMGLPCSTLADDTEIYTDSPSSTGIANILFNLDTSGSMGNTVDENNNGTLDSGERSRIEVLKDAMNTLLDSMPALNVGLMRYHRYGGPILFPVSNLNLDACDIEGDCPVASGSGVTGTASLASTIASDDSDAEEYDATTVVTANTSLTIGVNAAGSSCTTTTYTFNVTAAADHLEHETWNPSTHTISSSSVETGSSDMEIPKDGSTQQLNGVWFRDVDIPDETANLTIIDATISFIIDEQKSTSDEAVDIDIYAVEPDDINVSNKQLDDVNFKPEDLFNDNNHRFTTKVDWDIAASDDPSEGDPLVTSDVTALIREYLGHADWGTMQADEKNMVFLFEQDPATLSKTGVRTTERNVDSERPFMEITYQACASTASSNVRTGLLFEGVSIPQGVTIDSARIDFTASANDGGAPNFKIEIEDSDDAAAFSATPFSTGRTYDTTSVAWTTALGVDPLTDWVTDTVYSTPDLKTLLQEVANRAGWCGGNNILFNIERTGGDSEKRTAYSREGNSVKLPTLHVTYDNDTRHASAATGNPDYCSTSTIVRTVSTSSDDAEEDSSGAMDLGSSDLEMIQESTEQDIGIRFKDIPIAKDSKIVSAKLTFTVDEASTGTMTLNIDGEAADDAVTFSSGGSGTNNISDTTTRPRTSSGSRVVWSPPDFSTINNQHSVTGLEDIVQEIVDRSGWVAGNDLAILISGSGTTKRVAKSFDIDNGNNAPVLEITFQGEPVVTKQTVRARLKDIVDSLVQRSGTPIAGSMIEAARYFRGEEVLFGRQRGQQSSSDSVTRVSHSASYEANGALLVTPSGCAGEDVSSSSCITQHIDDTGTPKYKSPIVAECQTNYLINLTDGGGYFTGSGAVNTNGQSMDEDDIIATFDAEDSDEAAVTLGACATNVTLSDGTTYSGSSHNECAVNLAKFMNDNDQIFETGQTLQSGSSPIDGLQNVRTYTIGFNLCGTGNVTSLNASGEQVCCAVGNHDNATGLCSSAISDPDSITVLKAMADVGDGEYFNANTADELLAAFTAITSNIVQRSTSFVAPSIAANAFNRLRSRDEVYFGLFEPDENTRWQGNVKKYGLCINSNADGINNSGDECTIGDVLDVSGVVAVVDDAGQADDGLFKTTATSDWTLSADSPDGRTIDVGGAGGVISDFTERDIYTEINDDGQAASGGSLGPDFLIDSTTWDDAQFDLVRDHVCPVISTDTGTTDGMDCEDRMLFMLGKDSKNEDGDAATDTRWWFHDVLHSSPKTITFGLDENGNTDPSDDEFIDKVLVATNDGGLHMLNGGTGVEDWVFIPNDLFSIQSALYDNSGTDHTYGLDSTPITRIIDVDGDGIIEPEYDDDGDGTHTADEGDRVYVYITQRRGGRNMYALDITPSTGTGTLVELVATSDKIVPKLLWRIDGGTGDFARMGQSWSEPALGVIQAGTTGTGANEVPLFEDVLIFAGGYDPDIDDTDASVVNYNFGTEAGDPNEGNGIYIVNANTGALIFWVSSDTATVMSDNASTSRTGADIVVADMKYSMPSNVTAMDTNGDGLTDRVYVGDTAGQVWRLDIADDVDPGEVSPEGSSVVGKLAALSTAGTLAEERRIFYPPSVVQVIDTAFSDAVGGEFDYVLVPTGFRAHPLETTTKDRFYALRDATIDPMVDCTAPCTPDGLAEDYPTKIDSTTNSGAAIVNTDLVDISTIALVAASAKTSLGWYFDFNTNTGTTASGEKALAAPTVTAGALEFTTFTPSDPNAIADTCSASEGNGTAFNFNILTGNAALDWDGDGDIDLDDRKYALGSGIPSEVVPIFTEEGVTILVGTGGGAENLGQVSGLPRYRTYWYED